MNSSKFTTEAKKSLSIFREVFHFYYLCNMSNTYKHKNNGKFKNGLLEKPKQSLKNSWDRYNHDYGKFRAKKKKLLLKILDKEINY